MTFPTPPIAIPSGQMVRWSLAGSNVTRIGNPSFCFAESTQTTGFLSQDAGRPLGNTSSNIEWSDFDLVVPNGAAIQAMYPTVVISCALQHCEVGVGGTENIEGFIAGDNFSDVQYHGVSLGNTLGDLEAANITAVMDYSPFLDWTPADTFTLSFVGIAVYMTIPENWSNPTIVNINVGNTQPYPA